MRDEDKWKCPWCGKIATIVRQSIGDSRQCDCGAIAVGAPEGDWDEVTDEVLGLFEVPIRPESRGFDSLLREDIRRAGVEIREGVSDPDMGHPWGWAYNYTWFRRPANRQGAYFSFALCQECLAQYRSLVHDPTCQYGLNSIPLCSLEWPDEHPRDGVPDSFNHQSCRASIIRLAAARTQLWRTGAIPEESKELWAQAQRMIPNWPGFLRLSLSGEQRLSLEACARELADSLGALAKESYQMTFTDKGGGLTEFSARREEREAPRRRRWWEFWK